MQSKASNNMHETERRTILGGQKGRGTVFGCGDNTTSAIVPKRAAGVIRRPEKGCDPS